MGQKLKVPEARRAERGCFIGGEWVRFVDGVVHVPEGKDYASALPGFVAIVDKPAAVAADPLPSIDDVTDA
jgi:hypothetical protein